jgi:hypothetical protein
VDGLLGTWHIAPSLTYTRTDCAAVAMGGYVYIIGGYQYPYVLMETEYARVRSDGSLGPWQTTVPVTRESPAIVMGSAIYLVGGQRPGENWLSSVERAEANPDGSLDSWQEVGALPGIRPGLAAAAYGDFIYVIGGEPTGGITTSVLYAGVDPDGSLGPWQETAPTQEGRYGSGAVAIGNHLYILGGHHRLASVEVAEIHTDGSLGAWRYVTPMTRGRLYPIAVSARGYLYAIGDESSDHNMTIERAPAYADGSLGPWEGVLTGMPRRNFDAAVTGNRLSIYAGYSFCIEPPFLKDVEWATISPLSLGAVSPSAIPADRATAATFTGHNFLPGATLDIGTQDAPVASFVDFDTLTATLPAGLAEGWYTATVATLDGQAVVLTGALRVDGTAPAAESLVINGGAMSTTSAEVTLAVSASGADEMIFSNDGKTWGNWQPYATEADWTLVPGDGSKTVHGQFRDEASNESAVISDTIDLDTAAEAEYGVTINDGALFTSEVTVTLTIGAQPRTAQMQVSNDGGFGGAEWEPYISRRLWEITRYDHFVIPRVVYVRYKDMEGNTSGTYQDDIILDMAPPRGSVDAVVKTSSSAPHFTAAEAAVSATDDYTYTAHLPLVARGQAGPANVILYLSAEDDVSGVADMIISNQADFGSAVWETYVAARDWCVPPGATTTVFVKFRDHAGNVSAVATDDVAIP